MKTRLTHFALALALAGSAFAKEKPNDAPPLAPAQLKERAIHRRAVESVIRGMPAVNYRLMYQEMVDKVKGDFNQILYWSLLLSYLLHEAGKSHLDFNARWIHDFDVRNAVEGDGFSFVATLKF